MVFLQSFKKGRMAERLGTGLQNLLHRFESGSDLQKKLLVNQAAFFYGELGLHIKWPSDEI